MASSTTISPNLNELRLCTFNMRGFNSGVSTLRELTLSHNIIAVQEHWLSCDSLYKLDLINSEFYSYNASGMSEAYSSGLIKGRPFGGVAFLCHKQLPYHITL